MSASLLWAGLVVAVVGLVTVDLVASRGRHEAMPVSRALVWSSIWIGLSAAFGLAMWAVRGGEQAGQFFTAYLLEKSLSLDNLFVFMLIFSHFQVPAGEQHRVLTWGILGALVLRGVMIFGGLSLLHESRLVLYGFGAFLLFTGVRMLRGQGELDGQRLERRWYVRLLRRVVPFVPRYEGGAFFVVDKGRRVGTLLLPALLVIEVSDAMFAVDSVPAIFGVTEDSFIVFSSNILAILGLRALFFALAGLLDRLRYLHYGLGALLLLVGAKMCLNDLVQVPAWLSFALTIGVLAVTVLTSLAGARRPHAVWSP